ncbi:5-formyltetrahydrofolate cyclo-ligase [Tundrisphaera sp. TA3]|uniref:5-formyltetrahydrofolate cyclo-ligase n=1 Tax=Tundrisphaera sp. TA3 TaxID=3435775 RepID=UPI003EBBE0D3
MASIKREKAELRRRVTAAVLAMDPAERKAQEQGLADRLVQLPGIAGARSVLIYAGVFGDEIDTRRFPRSLLSLGKTAVYPTVDREARRLRLFAVEDEGRDLVTSPYGIPEPRAGCREVEPAEVDWVLVPGVAFDDRGFRLGRGGGYYDRLLPLLRPEVPRWALILTPQRVDRVPTEPHDQALDGIADWQRTVAAARAGVT